MTSNHYYITFIHVKLILEFWMIFRMTFIQDGDFIIALIVLPTSQNMSQLSSNTFPIQSQDLVVKLRLRSGALSGSLRLFDFDFDLSVDPTIGILCVFV